MTDNINQDSSLEDQGQSPKISFADFKRLEKLISIETVSSNLQSIQDRLRNEGQISTSDEHHITRASSHNQDKLLFIRLPKSQDSHVMTRQEADDFTFAIDTIRKIQNMPLSSVDLRHTLFKKGYLLVDLPWQIKIFETVCKNAFISNDGPTTSRG